jgi:hypothetical protein
LEIAGIKLGQISDSAVGTSFVDPDLKAFTANHSDMAAQYLRDMSGLATTDKEYVRTMDRLPSPYSKNYEKEMAAWKANVKSRFGDKIQGY